MKSIRFILLAELLETNSRAGVLFVLGKCLGTDYSYHSICGCKTIRSVLVHRVWAPYTFLFCRTTRNDCER